MFSKPFRATCTIFESISVRRSHKGLMQPSSTRCLRRRSKHYNIYSHLGCCCRKWSDQKWHVNTRLKKWSVSPDLLSRTTRCGVCDGPRRLLSCAELSYLQNTYQRGEQICIHHHLQVTKIKRKSVREKTTLKLKFMCWTVQTCMHLYLCTIPSCDIGDGPTCLFFNGLFRATQQVKQTLQGRAVKNHLCIRKQMKSYIWSMY